MKKVAAYFLLSIFLFNTMGYFVVFKFSQYQIKEAIKKDIENGVIDNALTSFEIKNADLSSINWTDGEDEFEYNGNRYDIVHQIATKNGITFFCINDAQEGKLFSNLDGHIKNHVTPTKPEKNNSTKSLTDDVVKFCSKDTFTVKAILPSTITKSFLPFILNYKFAVIKANFQPPELA